jgi:hypothetical protein
MYFILLNGFGQGIVRTCNEYNGRIFAPPAGSHALRASRNTKAWRGLRQRKLPKQNAVHFAIARHVKLDRSR